MLLSDELDILRPGAVLVLGERAGWAVGSLDGFVDVLCRAETMWRGRLDRSGWQAEVYGVAHPGARGGLADRSERALLRHLARTRRPAGTTIMSAN
jgi:hypothetical protein